MNLVRKSSAEELTDKISRGKIISKEHVLRESECKIKQCGVRGSNNNIVRRQAEDADIVVESTIMSLKDPISTSRISIPCRSTVCAHNQCFDALCFIQLQEQAPTWTCPICNKSISYEALVVDQYFQDVLRQTDQSINKVTIEPDGQWKKIVEGEENRSGPNKGRATYDDDSDDDLVEIPSDTGRVTQIKNEPQSATPGFAQQTPPLSSREPSLSNASATRPGYNQANSSKRPSSAVVDLTLSDDEDEPPRPAKRNSPVRPAFYNTPVSMTDPRANETQSQNQNQNQSQQQAAVPRFGSVSQPSNPYSRIQLPRPMQMPQGPTYGQSPNMPNNNLNNGHRLPFAPGQSYTFGSGSYQGTNGTFSGSRSPP